MAGTRVYTSACELGAGASSSENWHSLDPQYFSAAHTIDTAIKRSGRGSLRMSSGAGNTSITSYVWLKDNFGTGLGIGFYARAYILFDDLPSAGHISVMAIGNSGGTFSVLASVNSSGDVDLRYNGGTPVQGNTVTGLITSDTTWYRFEVYSNTDSGGADDSVAFYVDGNEIDSLSGVNTGLSLPSDSIELGWRSAPGANKVIHYDDLAVNIDAGGAFDPNNFPGAGQVVMHMPVADVSRVGWTGGAGGTTNLYHALNNIPPVGLALGSATDASQIKDLANNDTDKIQVEVESFTQVGVPLNAVIQYCQVYADVGCNPSNLDSYTVTPELNPSGPATTHDIFNAPSPATGTWPAGWSGVHGQAVVYPSVDKYARPQISLTKASPSAANTQMCDALVLVTDYLALGPDLVPPRVISSGLGW